MKILIMLMLVGCGSSNGVVEDATIKPPSVADESIILDEQDENVDSIVDPVISNFVFDLDDWEVVERNAFIGQSADIINGSVYFTSSGAEHVLEIDPITGEVVWHGKMKVNNGVIETHPVSVAHKDGYPTIIGGFNKFFIIDWDIFRNEKNLTNALISEVLEVNTIGYVRGSYAKLGEKTIYASGPYRQKDLTQDVNIINIYDASKLAEADATDELNVLLYTIERMPQFIQSYFWDGTHLILVMNTSNVVGMKLAYLNLETEKIEKTVTYNSIEELEGYAITEDGTEYLVTGETVPGRYYIRRPK
jgi:hypothetical protein